MKERNAKDDFKFRVIKLHLICTRLKCNTNIVLLEWDFMRKSEVYAGNNLDFRGTQIEKFLKKELGQYLFYVILYCILSWEWHVC